MTATSPRTAPLTKTAKGNVKSPGDKVAGAAYSFMSPNKDQSSQVTLSAWGRQLKGSKPSAPRVGEFLET